MKNGRVWCSVCGESLKVGQEDLDADGCWPECCGISMGSDRTPGSEPSTCSCNLPPGQYGSAGWHHTLTTQAYWERRIWREDFQAPRGQKSPSLDEVAYRTPVFDPDTFEELSLEVTIRQVIARKAAKMAGTRTAVEICPLFKAGIARQIAQDASKRSQERERGAPETSF